MLNKKKKEKLDGRLHLALEKIFYNESFITEIEEYRKKIGIPKKGYTEFNEYYFFLEGKDSEEKTRRQIMQFSMVGDLMRLGVKYKYPTNYVFWIEAFLALGYNYKKFEDRVPYNNKRQTFIYGMTCTLDDLNLKDDNISFSVYPGATLNSVHDFFREHWDFIDSILKVKSEHFGKTPSVRKVGNRDKLKILELADNKKISSAGTWIGEDAEPDCLDGAKADQRKKIIAEERRKRRIRENR